MTAVTIYWEETAMITVENAVTAASFADEVAGVLAADTATSPDGRCRIKLPNGWSWWIVDDACDDAPNGLSWWIDSPTERLVESDGWVSLTEDQLSAEAAKMADYLMVVAQR